jgi:dTDP-glucose 4,6-dehydratase
MKIFLTGASGFVGSHVLKYLLMNTDAEIVCPVTYKHKGIPDRINLQTRDFDRVKIIRHDLIDELSPVLIKQIGEIDWIINIASESHVDRSMETPAPFIVNNNTKLIVNVLEYARKTNVKKILHISTDEVYGPAKPGYSHMEWKDLHLPSNPYSASKAAQESICFSYWRTYGLPIGITNSMNIFGETQDTEKFIPKIIKMLLRGEEIPIHSCKDGEPGSRYYLYAMSQADALIWILQNFDFPKYGEADKPLKYNVTGDVEVDNYSLAKMISEMVGETLKYKMVDFHTPRPGHDLRYALNGNKLRNAGWRKPYTFEESLQKTVDWYLYNTEWLEL